MATNNDITIRCTLDAWQEHGPRLMGLCPDLNLELFGYKAIDKCLLLSASAFPQDVSGNPVVPPQCQNAPVPVGIFERLKGGEGTAILRRYESAELATVALNGAALEWAREQQRNPAAPTASEEEDEKDVWRGALTAWLEYGPGVVRQRPGVRVEITDRKPLTAIDGPRKSDGAWCNKDSGWVDQVNLPDDWLDLMVLRCEPQPHESRGVGSKKWRTVRWPTEQEARNALNGVALVWAREEAERREKAATEPVVFVPTGGDGLAWHVMDASATPLSPDVNTVGPMLRDCSACSGRGVRGVRGQPYGVVAKCRVCNGTGYVEAEISRCCLLASC